MTHRGAGHIVEAAELVLGRERNLSIRPRHAIGIGDHTTQDLGDLEVVGDGQLSVDALRSI